MTVYIVEDADEVQGVFSIREKARDCVTEMFKRQGRPVTAPYWHTDDPRDYWITEHTLDPDPAD